MGWKDSDANDKEEKPRISFLEKGMLSLNGFLIVYKKELWGGEFWGIAHDLDVLGEPLLHISIFVAQYNCKYCSAALRLTDVLNTLCNRPCPNDVEPPNHLPASRRSICIKLVILINY
jgi:hypothetical protein